VEELRFFVGFHRSFRSELFFERVLFSSRLHRVIRMYAAQDRRAAATTFDDLARRRSESRKEGVVHVRNCGCRTQTGPARA